MGKPVIQTAHSASRRGNRVPKPSQPWKRPDLLAITDEQRAKYKGMRPRWLRKGTDGDRTRIDEKQAQGYVLDQSRGMRSKGDKNVDESGISSATTRRDLVLAWLPEERYQARQHYLQEESDRRQQVIGNQFERGARGMGGEARDGDDAIPGPGKMEG